MRIFGFTPIVNALFLLTVSFFVLLAASRSESRGLKQFGRIIAVAFWIIAASIVVGTVYLSLTDDFSPYKPRIKLFRIK